PSGRRTRESGASSHGMALPCVGATTRGVRAVAMLLVCLALAATALGREDRPRGCDVGSTAGCDDGDPCTTDVCAGTHCRHTPATGPACDDHDGCTEHDHCEAGRCVGTPVTCEDDGFSCTDDVCLAGRCTHVPVAARCVPADACTTAVC